jgi:AcrR family transcriptional regulator
MTRQLQDYRSGAQKLLVTAERLFGERGLDGVSLRQVAMAAGHANNSAVQHHFRSKEGLILAVFQMRVPLLESARQQWLERIDKNGSATFENVLAALLMPIVHALNEPTRTTFAMFGLRLMDGDVAERTISEQVSPSSAEIASRLEALLPELPPAVFAIRYRFAVRLFLNGFIELKRMRHSHNNPYASEETFWDDVFQSSVAAFRTDFPAAETLQCGAGSTRRIAQIGSLHPQRSPTTARAQERNLSAGAPQTLAAQRARPISQSRSRAAIAARSANAPNCLAAPA